MVFGGRKFRNWKKQNPEGIYGAFRDAGGNSTEMDRILNERTNNECRKQIKDFINESKKLGFYFKPNNMIYCYKNYQNLILRQTTSGNINSGSFIDVNIFKKCQVKQ